MTASPYVIGMTTAQKENWKKRCQTCIHPKVHDINIAVLKGIYMSELAEEYKLSYTSLRNHALKHMNEVYAHSLPDGDLLTEELQNLERIAATFLDEAVQNNDVKHVMFLLEVRLNQWREKAKLLTALNRGAPQRQYDLIGQALIRFFSSHPEMRDEFKAYLQEIGEGTFLE